MRITITGGNPLLRMGVIFTLQDLLPLAQYQEADSIEICIQTVLSVTTPPDLVIMLGVNGVANGRLKLLHRIMNRTKLLLLVDGPPAATDGERLLTLGARGYLSVDSSAGQLRQAVQTVLAGDIYHDQGRQAPPPGRMDTMAERSEWARLTRREKEIARLLLLGLANKEIARELDLQEVTIKYHLTRVFRKLGVSNRTQAVSMLMAPPDDPVDS